MARKRPRKKSKGTRARVRPGAEDIEWVLARVTAPVYVEGEGGAVRPDMVVCLDPVSDKLLAAEFVPPDAPADVVIAIMHQAMTQPMVGRPTTPTSVRVNDPYLASLVRQQLGLAAREAPTPELQGVLDSFRQFSQSHPPPVENGGFEMRYLDTGATPAEVGLLFANAARLHRKALWRWLSDVDVVRVSIPVLGVQDACVSVMGAAGETFGYSVFDSLTSYEAVRTAEQVVGDARPKLAGPVYSLTFNRATDLPPSLSEEQRTNGWEVADETAFPLILRIDADMVPSPLRRDDVVRCTAIAEALILFWEHSGDAWAAGDDPAAEVTLSSLPGAPAARMAAQCMDPVLEESDGVGGPRQLFNHVISELMEKALDDRKLSAELEAARDFYFWGRRPPPHMDTERAFGAAHGRLLEWFVFERVSHSYGELPLQTILRRAPLAPAKQELAQRMGASVVGVFLVEKVVPEESLTLRNAAGGPPLAVPEKLATRDLRVGDYLVGRLFPLDENTWVLSGGMEYRQPAHIPDPRRLLDALDADDSGHVSQRQLERLLMGDEGVHHPEPLAFDTVKKRVSRVLRRIGSRQTVAQLRKQLSRFEHPLAAVQSLLQDAAKAADEEALFELFMLVGELWNQTPRTELGGKTPMEMMEEQSIDGPGEEERGLMAAFARHVEQARLLQSSDVAVDDIGEAFSQWMATPQEILGGLTPAEVIERERQTRGSQATRRSRH